MRFLYDFEAGFTLLIYNLKVHFTFSAISIVAPPLLFVHIAPVRAHPLLESRACCVLHKPILGMIFGTILECIWVVKVSKKGN